MKLTAEQAKRFVQYRDIKQSFSNKERMARQNRYLSAIGDNMKDKIITDSDYFTHIFSSIQEYLITDMGESQIDYLLHCNIKEPEFYSLPGEWKNGNEYDEFHVNENELHKMIMETFYICQ